jgi:uncharacterized iron-regulated membrane protein
MTSRGLRKFAFQLHRFVGLNLCILFLISFVTGTLLLFSAELILIGRPDLWIARTTPVANASFGQNYDSIKAAVPGVKIAYMLRAPRPWFGDTTYAGDSNNQSITVWTDPKDARFLGVSGGNSKLRDTIRGLHVDYLVPLKAAKLGVGALSIVLLTMVISGLISYRRFWKGLLRKPDSSAEVRQKMGAWHRLFAAWVWPFLLVVSLTGMIFLANDAGIEPAHPAAQPVAPRDWSLAPDFDGTALDAIIQVAQAAKPGLIATQVALPTAQNQPVSISGYLEQTGAMFGKATVSIDPLDMHVVEISDTANANIMGKIYPVAVDLHYGHWAGFTSTLIWTVFGSLAIMLAVAGARLSVARLRAEARTAMPEKSGHSAFRVFIDGLGMVKFGYALLFLGMAAAIVRFVLK